MAAETLEACGTTPDTRTGHYYVSCINGAQKALVTGPYDSHAEALADVERVRTAAGKMDPRCDFYAWGTARIPKGERAAVGRWNAQIGMPAKPAWDGVMWNPSAGPKAACGHKPERLHSWHAADGVLCIACNDCGSVLKGGVA